jgi:hypothetical protein
MRLTLKDLERLKREGKIKGFTVKEEKKSKRAKYNNEKVVYNDMTFDSRKEYRVYRDCELLLKAGKIGQLRRQVRYDLKYEDRLICKYYADIVYMDAETGKDVVIDVKSDATRKLPTYRLKRKMMKEILGIEIIEK